jgi:hypothetical protein
MKLAAHRIVLALTLAWWPSIASALESTQTYEFGYLGSTAFRNASISRNAVYAQLEDKTELYSNSQTGSSWLFRGALRAMADQQGELSLRALSIEHSSEHLVFRLGYQQVAWGETFGFFISDIVNPRDYRDPLFVEMDFIRVPVFLANAQLSFDKLRVQALGTPLPRNDMMAASGTEFDLVGQAAPGFAVRDQSGFPLSRLGRDSEAGGRVSYLVGEKLDIAALYYFHWNRFPVYQVQFDGLSGALVPIRSRVHSVGLSFSYALDSWVFRGDGIANIHQPIQPVGIETIHHDTQLQAILGTDTTTQSEWTFGFQYHVEHFDSETKHWMSARASKSLFKQVLVPECFIFRGIDNTDMWISPKVSWTMLDHLTVSARADLLWGSTDSKRGQLGLLRDKDRFLLWVSAHY